MKYLFIIFELFNFGYDTNILPYLGKYISYFYVSFINIYISGKNRSLLSFMYFDEIDDNYDDYEMAAKITEVLHWSTRIKENVE